MWVNICIYIRRPLVAVRGSAPRKLLQKIVVERWGFAMVWWLAGFQGLTLRKGLPCLRQLFFFVFSRFQKQRFGIFLAAVSHGLGTISLFLVGSKSDVSAFFRLRFRNGLGTKPAGVLLFRMRVPNTFFLSLAWWLAGFQVLRCAKVCLAVSHGLGTICDCGRTVGYLTMAPLHGTSFAVCACRNRFAKGTARMLFLKAACNGYQSFVFYGFQKQRFGLFQAAVSQWLGHKTCWGSAFSHARPKHVFPWVLSGGLRAFKSYVAQRFALLEATFFFVFSRFQKQRFGIFLAAVLHGLGTISLILVGSKSDVSAFFRLRFRNGLGTKPAGVLLFRMRVPNTFFLSVNTKGLEYPRNLSSVTQPLFWPSAPNFAVSSVRGRRHGRQPFNIYIYIYVDSRPGLRCEWKHHSEVKSLSEIHWQLLQLSHHRPAWNVPPAVSALHISLAGKKCLGKIFHWIQTPKKIWSKQIKVTSKHVL